MQIDNFVSLFMAPITFITTENLCGIPDEIWLKILRFYLGFNPDVGRLFRLGSVCKKMYVLPSS